MALIDLTPQDRPSTLHVDTFGLSVGALSVGLPASCTTDTILLRYLDLLAMCADDSLDADTLADHRETLAEVTALSPDALERRLGLLSA
ncbi:MAG: hypothetical protein AAGA37_07480 [Actinomycetota bacterium]